MKSKILNILILLLILPVFANAETFKDGDTTYVLEERKISCLSEDATSLFNKEDSLYFYTQKDEKTTFIKVNLDNNECVEVSEEEIYSLTIDRMEDYYFIENTENGYVIEQRIDYYDLSDYKKTKDTTLVEGKSYFKKDQYGTTRVSEEDLKIEDIGTYYEELYLEIASGKEFDINETYYILNREHELEVVNNPEADKINSYYIESEKPFEIKNIQTLNTEAIKNLIDSTIYMPNVEKIGDNFYILVGKEKNIDENIGLILYDLYDINGNKIETITDVVRINSINNNLIIIYKEDSMAFYNTSLNKLHDINIENINSLYAIFNNNYVNYFIAWDETNEKEKFYNLYEYKVLEQVEEVSNDKDVSFKFSGRLDKLSKVLLNDIELDKENYTLESGSTIITLKSDYLKTLKEGNYTLKVEYGDEVSLETTFKLKGSQSIIPNIPDTLDNVYTYAILSFISIGIIINCLFSLRKRTTKNSRY